MQYIGDEIKINIFKYVNYPLNLALTCRNWSVVIKNPYAKSKWLIVNYGKAHALFYAIRLGPTFIDIVVYQTLITRKVPIFTRHFIQRLIQQCNADQICAYSIYAFQQKIKLSYMSNLLNEGLSNETLTSKGNDIHAISQSSHVINHVLGGNILKCIEDLILNILLPRKPKSILF